MCHYRFGIIIALALCSPRVAAGQVPVASTAVDTTALALARRLLEAMRYQQTLLDQYDSASVAMRSQGTHGPAVYFDSLAARVHREAPHFVDSLAVDLAGKLSVADLQDVARFFESPVGQRYLSAWGRAMQQQTTLWHRWLTLQSYTVTSDLLEKGLISASDLPH